MIIQVDFRGKNKFGGVVRNWVMAQVDLQGNVMSILANGDN
jgi:hypothetical protein